MRPRNHHRPIPPTRPLIPLYRRPLSFSAFAASPAVSPLLVSLLSFSPTGRHPSSCLQQPYKPWSSAGASSFTRAMYPDVSEGRNFASVCVNHFYLSRSLLLSFSLTPSSSLSPSPFLGAFPPSSSSFTCLRSCKVSRVYTRDGHIAARTCATRVHARHTAHIYVHRDVQTCTGENSVCRDVGLRVREISRMTVSDQSKDNRNPVRAAVFSPYVRTVSGPREMSMKS